MAPVIPTHRPFVTPERAAIAVAVVAVACSLFLAFGVARADPTPAARQWACVAPAADAGWAEVLDAFDANPLRLQ